MKIDLDGVNAPVSLPDELRHRILRLRHITGFVTTFGEEQDPRVKVFARLWHVQRVTSLARQLATDSDSVDLDRIIGLAWMHDLNRWPFAHNIERGSFDQAANVADYFEGLGLPGRDISDLGGIHRKDLLSLSPEARVVLFADALTGIVEDLLFAVTGLNVHPRLIPDDIDALLGYALKKDPLLSECRALTEQFHDARFPDVELYCAGFNSLFQELVQRFLSHHHVYDIEQDYPGVFDIARMVKETFTRPVIFPINNERVCRSSWLRHKVLPWYFQMKGGSRARLLEMDETQFVDEVTSAPHSPFTRTEFVPDIDVVQRELPHLAFVNAGPGTRQR
ncbi:hypothetical protein [Planotetraspora kaengkrachanensis]|uniref:HD domain-containing protein n=1 Tax=Planotetraspora kaengkrachanensis TaxID=575193 RepID=A0A8J3PY22_9ACTN|nr:hypothetical protein [Planotetraspora kaengkrachanensis]GIG83138.1 hypothetical protein Pka01_62650 [Planotetraspora kaengkrachanensis]